jgi:hypothetical protein
LVERFENVDQEHRVQMLRTSSGSPSCGEEEEDEDERVLDAFENATETDQIELSGSFTFMIPSLFKVAELKEQLQLRGVDCKAYRKAELAAMLQDAVV